MRHHLASLFGSVLVGVSSLPGSDSTLQPAWRAAGDFLFDEAAYHVAEGSTTSEGQLLEALVLLQHGTRTAAKVAKAEACLARVVSAPDEAAHADAARYLQARILQWYRDPTQPEQALVIYDHLAADAATDFWSDLARNKAAMLRLHTGPLLSAPDMLQAFVQQQREQFRTALGRRDFEVLVAETCLHHDFMPQLALEALQRALAYGNWPAQRSNQMLVQIMNLGIRTGNVAAQRQAFERYFAEANYDFRRPYVLRFLDPDKQEDMR